MNLCVVIKKDLSMLYVLIYEVTKETYIYLCKKEYIC